MTTDEIMEMQNKIALKEFETNYNLSEYVRVANDMNDELEYVKLAKELQSKLQEQLIEQYDQVSVSTQGTITLYKKVGENAKKIVASISATIKLPYRYVMGGKVGKKEMQEIVDRYNKVMELVH